MSDLSDYGELEYLIDSDNQLPGEYFEDDTVPAYDDDTRFEKIKFNWLRSYNEVQPDERQTLQNDNNKSRLVQKDFINTDILYENTKNLDVGVKYLIVSHYFKMEDIVCLKSVEAQMSEANLLWFIQFLIYRSVNSYYNHPRGSLVADYKIGNSGLDNFHLPIKSHEFEIVIED